MKSNKSGVTVTYSYDKWYDDAPNWYNDFVKVIRCKDCARNDNCFMYRESEDDDGFCAWAKRREK